MMSSPQQTFFHNAKDVAISRGNFTNVSNAERIEKTFQSLLKHVVTTAFHDSIQRGDPPRCHENTRKAILEELFDWIIGKIPRATWIAWLNGAAGAGKSAICQSLAELCILRGVIVASFFFFRTDLTQNTIDHLIPTLAYQIIQKLPETKELILQAIEENPLIFEQSVETQFNALVMEPLRHFSIQNPSLKMVVIIDGVDECEGSDKQVNLIKTIAKIFQSPSSALTVLFASRREYDLQMAFSTQRVERILSQFPLDDNYKAEEDIRLYLNDKFDEIKHSHPFKTSLSEDWPSTLHVQDIVDKSSGQFIYASVVIDFLFMPTSHPVTQLEIVRGLRLNPSGRKTPFAELDILYQHIFSRLVNLQMALDILAYTIFGKPESHEWTCYFLKLTKEDTKDVLAPLVSVLGDLDGDHLTFRHASLPDFLCDKARSQKYYISRLNTRLSILWFDNLASGRYANFVRRQFGRIIVHLEHAEATIKLQEKILEYTPSKQDSAFFRVMGFKYYPKQLLDNVRQLFGESGKAYRYLLDEIVHYVTKEFPENIIYLGQFTKPQKSPKPDSDALYATVVRNSVNSNACHPRTLQSIPITSNRISGKCYPARKKDRKQSDAGTLFDNTDYTASIGGIFKNGSGAKDVGGFRLLRKHVNVSAIIDPNKGYNPPCFNSGIRVYDASLGDSFAWIVDKIQHNARITLLRGPQAYGTGKNSICNYIAKLCILGGIPVASYVFIEHHSTQKPCATLVATLAYQVTQVFPRAKRHITQAIESNPSIFDQSLEAQFNALIVEPLSRNLPASDSSWKLVCIISGIDECSNLDERTDLIRTIAKILQPGDLPLIFLFSTHVERDILTAFSAPIFDSILSRCFLDNDYRTDKDIHSVLTSGCAQIKQMHPFKHILGCDWPTPSTIQEIVDQSSGQFLYAVTVIIFLSLPTSHPANQLAIVRTLRLDPSVQRTPFAQLDVLYRHIFSQLVDLQAVLDHLAYAIFIKPQFHNTNAFGSFFQTTKEETQNILAPMVPLVLCLHKDNFGFRHPIPDFLCDKARAQQYCVSAFPTRLCRLWLKNLASGRYIELSAIDIYDLIYGLLEYTTLSVEQDEEIRAIRVHKLAQTDDSLKVYLSAIRKIVRYVNKLPPCDSEDIAEYDISQVLAKMESDERAAEVLHAVVLEALPFNAELDSDSTSSISEYTHSLRTSATTSNISKVCRQEQVAESPSRNRTAEQAPGISTPRKIPASGRSDAALRAPHLAGHRRANPAQAAPASSRPNTTPQATLSSRIRSPAIRAPPSEREMSTVRGTPSNIRARGLASRIPSSSSRSSTRPTAGWIAGKSSRAADANAEKASSSASSASGSSGVNRNRPADGASSVPMKAKSASGAVGDARTPVRVRRQGAGKSVEAKAVPRGGSSKKPAWK